MARVPGADAIYDVANLFRQRCLIDGRSLMNPQLELSPELLGEVIRSLDGMQQKDQSIGTWTTELRKLGTAPSLPRSTFTCSATSFP